VVQSETPWSLTHPRRRTFSAATARRERRALRRGRSPSVLFWPVHVDGRGGLFRFDPVLDLLGRFGIPAWASYPFVEFAANAALFLPLGVLWALVVDRWPARSASSRPERSARRSA
jgi:hypothetical protein